MNSRERVKITLNHEEPDMVPIDFGGHQSGIHIKAYKKLLDYLEIKDSDIRYCDFVQQIALPCEELLERFNVDIRYVRPIGGMVNVNEFQPQYEGNYVGVYDQFGCFWGNDVKKDLDEILYYDPVIHPFADLKSEQEIENYDWPNGKDINLRNSNRLVDVAAGMLILKEAGGIIFSLDGNEIIQELSISVKFPFIACNAKLESFLKEELVDKRNYYF